MGSEQNDRNGLDRDGDGGKGFAHQFTILNVDIPADELKKRYEGTKRYGYACAVIDGLVQRQRTLTAKAPPWMVRLMRANSSHVPPIKVADLGRDGTLDGWEFEREKGAKRGKRMGKNWAVVDDGRQRVMTRRELDAEADEAGAPRKQLSCVYDTYSAKDTRKDAVMSRVVANLREPRSFSSRAEDAADMKREKYTDEDIAPFAEAKDAAEVVLLLALHKCIQDVKDAVNAGKVLLRVAAKWADLSDEEQAEKVARALGGRKPREVTAKTRTRPAPILASIEQTVRASIPTMPGHEIEVVRLTAYAEALRVAQGGDPPAWAKRFHDASEDERKAARKRGEK